MLRNNQAPESKEVLVDMSQYSIESGRNSIQKQYGNLLTERDILKKQKLKLERSLIYWKSRNPTGRTRGNEHIERHKIIDEITEIQERLITIKPTLSKLNFELNKDKRQHSEILEDMLVALKQIAERLSK